MIARPASAGLGMMIAQLQLPEGGPGGPGEPGEPARKATLKWQIRWTDRPTESLPTGLYVLCLIDRGHRIDLARSRLVMLQYPID